MAIATPSRRRRIEDVASELFREHGYAATSVRDIARALDIKGASVYAHVASKEDVLWAIVDRAAGRFEVAAETVEARTIGRSATDRLAALARAHVEVIVADIGAASVFVHEWRSLGGERREAISLRRDAYERRFRRLIEDGMATGELVVTDPAVAAAFVLTALNGLATWYRPDGRLSPDRIADHYADLAVRALTEEPR
jgi:TetR/AcrR family transcriptional regulator, cholesterol catabolism regulator